MNYRDVYLEELTALRELGREFAQQYPRLAPFLAVDAQDPDVERLLEGFAFLSARLRQRLDDGFPELSHTLLRVLWPHLLRPVPAMTTLEFRPLPVLGEGQQIPRGTGVASQPVQGTVCRFRTCAPVTVYPLIHERLDVRRLTQGALIRLTLRRQGPGLWSRMGLDRLRLHLHGDVKLSLSLYWLLLAHTRVVRAWLVNSRGERQAVALGADAILRPAGFDDDAALLPGGQESFPGFRLLHEYFCYPEKFLYMDLGGLKAIGEAARLNPELEGHELLELEFELDRDLPSHLTPVRENIRLFCTPVVNLFSAEARPMEVEHRRHEYRLMPEGQPGEHYDIYSVDEVTAWQHQDRQQIRYASYDAFAYCRMPEVSARHLFWQRLKPSVISPLGYDTYLSFLSHEPGAKWPQRETVSARLTCTNRNLPVELALGDVCEAMPDTPEFVTFSNISPVTPCLFPIPEPWPLWQLLGYLSQGYRSLAQVETLRSLMAILDVRSHYDPMQAQASRHKREALTGMKLELVDRLWRGLMCRGLRLRVEVREELFMGEGDLYLFGTVLDQLFASKVPLNSFHELELHDQSKGVLHRWQPNPGRRQVL